MQKCVGEGSSMLCHMYIACLVILRSEPCLRRNRNCSLVRGGQNLCVFALSLKVVIQATMKIRISYVSINTGVSERRCTAPLILSHSIRRDGRLDTRTDCFTSPLPFEAGLSPKPVSKLWKRKISFLCRETNNDLPIMH